jgi:hypothetical protein
VKGLESGTNISVTNENANQISLLAKEFCLDELLSECVTIQAASDAEITRTPSESISQTDDQTFSKIFDVARELKELIAILNRSLDNLRSRISELEANFVITQAYLEKWQSDTRVEFPLEAAKSVDEIISYPTRKHGKIFMTKEL